MRRRQWAATAKALVPRELHGAQRLFDARRWAQARAGYEPLLRAANGDDKELIALRLAECAYYLDRFSESRKALQPFLDGSRREAEARYFHLAAVRGAGDSDTFVSLVRGLVADHSESEWAAEALNNLASYYIVVDRDADADQVFRDCSAVPRHRYSERAAWKAAGLLSLRQLPGCGNRSTVARYLCAIGYRPSWLYCRPGPAINRHATRQTRVTA